MKKIIVALMIVLLSSFAYAGGLSDMVVQVGKDQVTNMVFQTPAGQEAYNYFYAVKDPKSFAMGKVCEDESMQEACQTYQTAQGFYNSPFDAALGQLCQQESASDACQGYQQINMFKTALRDPGALATGPLKGAAKQQVTSKLDMQGMNKYMGMYGQVSKYMNILTSGKNVKRGSPSGTKPSSSPTGGAVADVKEYGSGILPQFSKETDCSIGFNIIELEGRSISDLKEEELSQTFGDIFGRNCLTKTSGDISVFFGKKEGTVKIGKDCKILKEGSSFSLVAKSEECYIESGRRRYMYLSEEDLLEINITTNEVIKAELHPTKETNYIFFDKNYRVKPGMSILVGNGEVIFKLEQGMILPYSDPLDDEVRTIRMLEGTGLIIKGNKITGKKFDIDFTTFSALNGDANVLMEPNGLVFAPGTLATKNGFSLMSQSNTVMIVDETGHPPESETWIQLSPGKIKSKVSEEESLAIRVHKENDIFKMDSQDDLGVFIEDGAEIEIQNRDTKIPLITPVDSSQGKLLVQNGKKNIVVSEGKIYFKANNKGAESVALQVESEPGDGGYIARSGYAQNFGISSKKSIGDSDTLLVDKFSGLTVSEYQAEANKEIQNIKQLQEKYPDIKFKVRGDPSKGTLSYVDPYTLNIIDNYLQTYEFQGKEFNLEFQKRASAAGPTRINLGTDYFNPNKDPEIIEDYLGIVFHEGNHVLYANIVEKQDEFTRTASETLYPQIDWDNEKYFGRKRIEEKMVQDFYSAFMEEPQAQKAVEEAVLAVETLNNNLNLIPEYTDEQKENLKKDMEAILKYKDYVNKNPGLMFEYVGILQTFKEQSKETLDKINTACNSIGLRRCYFFRDYRLDNPGNTFALEEKLIKGSRESTTWIPQQYYKEGITVRNEASREERRQNAQENPNPKIRVLHKKAAHLDYEAGIIDKEDCEIITGEECTPCEVDGLMCYIR